jgi:hypothetical protein
VLTWPWKPDGLCWTDQAAGLGSRGTSWYSFIAAHTWCPCLQAWGSKNIFLLAFPKSNLNNEWMRWIDALLKTPISGLLPPQVLLSHILHAESRVSDPLPPLMACRWLDRAYGAKVKLAARVAHHSATRLSTERHSPHYRHILHVTCGFIDERELQNDQNAWMKYIYKIRLCPWPFSWTGDWAVLWSSQAVPAYCGSQFLQRPHIARPACTCG